MCISKSTVLTGTFSTVPHYCGIDHTQITYRLAVLRELCRMFELSKSHVSSSIIWASKVQRPNEQASDGLDFPNGHKVTAHCYNVRDFALQTRPLAASINLSFW